MIPIIQLPLHVRKIQHLYNSNIMRWNVFFVNFPMFFDDMNWVTKQELLSNKIQYFGMIYFFCYKSKNKLFMFKLYFCKIFENIFHAYYFNSFLHHVEMLGITRVKNKFVVSIFTGDLGQMWCAKYRNNIRFAQLSQVLNYGHM